MDYWSTMREKKYGKVDNRLIREQIKIAGLVIGLLILTGCSKGQIDDTEQMVKSASSIPYHESITGKNNIETGEKTIQQQYRNDTDYKEKKAEVILPEGAEDNPYPWPVLTEGKFYVGNLDTACLDQMVKRLCYDLFLPMQTLEIPDMTSYIEDNPKTHLALRWPELYVHQVKEAPWKQVVKITSLETNSGKMETENGNIFYYTMCELRYDRKDPSVNGCNIDVKMQVEVVEEQLKIVGLEMGFDSRYRDLLAGIEAEDGEQGISIKEIDQAFDKLMEAQ